MSELKSNTEIKMGSPRSFGIVFAVVFTIIAVWPLAFHGGDLRLWAFAVAAVFLVLALVVPDVLQPLNKLWFKFGLLLNKIVSPIVMGILFFITVTPIGLIRRIKHKDPLKQKLDPNAESYWIVRGEDHPTTSMKKQF